MPTSEVLSQGIMSSQGRIADIHDIDTQSRIWETTPFAKSPITRIAQRTQRFPVKTSDYVWFEKGFAANNGTVLDVYSNPDLSTAYTTGGVDGTMLYITMTAAHAKQLIKDQILALWCGSDYDLRRVRVCDVQVAGDTTSYAAVKLQETDTSNKLAQVTIYFNIAGSTRSEGAGLPDTIFRDLTKRTNQTEISMMATQITGTEMAQMEKVNPGKAARLRREALYDMTTGQELAILFHTYHSEQDPDTGQEIRETRGIYDALTTYESTNLFNYVTDTDYSGKTWLAGGWDWLKTDVMLTIGRWTEGASDSGNRLLFTGDLGMQAICDLAEDQGIRVYDEEKSKWGLARIKKLQGLEIDLEIAVHPLFKVNTHLQRQAFIYNPEWLEYVYLKGDGPSRDVTFVPAGKDVNGFTWRDAKKEGWYAEWGIRWHNLCGMGWLRGLGSTNTA